MEFKKEINNECAFHLNNPNGVCSSDEIVNKLKDFVVNFSVVNEEKVHPTNSTDIINSLKKKYNCDSESCVLTQKEVKQHINSGMIDTNLRNNFKPKGPRNTFAWLSNFDIDDVLKQIQQKYKDKHFFHIPFQMRDFEKNNTELAQLDFPSEYKKGFRTFGTVLNTDYSTGNGIHWFAIFGDFQDNPDNAKKVFTIEYFNSSGEMPLEEVSLWMNKVKHLWSKEMNVDIDVVFVSNIQMQYDNHSCGAYSLYYIISRLDGVPYITFKKKRVPDEKMHLFRKYLFRDED